MATVEDIPVAQAVTTHLVEAARLLEQALKAGCQDRQAAYMLAMKLMALRIDPAAETQDLPDILALIEVVGLQRKEDIVEFAASFYPEARISGKLHLAIDAIWRERQRWEQNERDEPPRYLGRGRASR